MEIRLRFPAFACLLVVASQFCAADSQDLHGGKPLPTFEDFPAKSSPASSKYASKPILTTAQSRLYRTVISIEGRKAPNFAGHYRMVIWGCGTDCRGFAIVDRLSGHVFTPSGIANVAGAMGNDEPRVDFRADSRLLVLNGYLNETDEGKFFYEWTGRSLKLLKRAPLVKQDFLDDSAERE